MVNWLPLLSPWLPCVAFLLWFLLKRKATQEGQGESRGQPVDHRTGCSLPCVAFLLASLLENPHTNTHRGARGGSREQPVMWSTGCPLLSPWLPCVAFL